MKRYNPSDIEPKWQQIWHDDKRYEAKDFDVKQKYYVTGMFPYPSGAGMHTGHFFEHSIVDAVARFQRANGRNVMYPMGFDNFGLPAENYAIKTGISPQQATRDNIANFKNQLTRVGASIDWSRELWTSDPEYYKWTQWIFTQLYERNLAYQKESLQWWCPVDKTVLANEQVENGKCWRCGNTVVKKSMKQWFFKITDYADALLDEIPALNWPDKIKTAQTNWIGRSQGAEIDFQIVSNGTPNFVILHGYTGHANRNFIPKVKADLEAKGYKVQAPQLPNTDAPVETEQVGYVLENCTFDENTVLIGHSLGGGVAMKVVQQLSHPIAELILVAPVVEADFRPKDYDRPFITTFDLNYDYELIKKQTSRRVVLSDTAETDRAPYLEFLAPKIDAELITATAAKKHFTATDEPAVMASLSQIITVFSTRPDTLFGASFVVLAPEHPLAKRLATDSERQIVNDYIDAAVKKSEIERQSEGKEKTGVFTGSYAINPVNGAKVPIWVADYVLGGYGTGAVMAVPAHDERDYEFATKFDLPITQVVAYDWTPTTGPSVPRDGLETIRCETADAILHDGNGNYVLEVEQEGDIEHVHFVGGKVDPEDDDKFTTVRREVLEEVGFTDIKNVKKVAPLSAGTGYRHTSNRNQYCESDFYEVELSSTHQVPSEIEDGKHSIRWVKKDDVATAITWDHHRWGWQQYLSRTTLYSGEGVLINSGEFDGMSTSDAREQIVAWLQQQGLGRSKITYKMRDWLISRQRYWGAPIPIVYCADHGAVPVPADQLPVVLPEVEDYAPKGDGKSVLARETDWVNTTCPTCGGAATRETDTMDGYACSSWYLLRYTDPHDAAQAWNPKLAEYWTPLDMYIGGDHAVAHLLYVRFWSHVFYDMGLVPSKEPVKQLVYHGLIQAEDGTKMSKSKGNVVDPLEVIDAGYGADALRTYELFLGPINENSSWSSKGIAGVHRFLNRLWTLTQEYDEACHSGLDGQSNDNESTKRLETATHITIKKVTTDIHRLSFNTAISALMEYVNDLYKLKTSGFSADWQQPLETLVQLVQPFAPHMAAELWQQLGHSSQLDFEAWPQWDEALTVGDTMTIAIQVNGKLRGEIAVAKDAAKESIEAAALAQENVARTLADAAPKKVIYVPGRLVNIVI